MIEKIKSYAIVFLLVALFVQSKKYEALRSSLLEAQQNTLSESVRLHNEIADIKEKYDYENKKANDLIIDLRKRVANGVRLKNRDLPDGASSENREDGCNLGARTANDLISIAERGDQAIRSLNKCIDSYNAIKNRKKDK